jgi:uncharacterized iron-regulated membrane protein
MDMFIALTAIMGMLVSFALPILLVAVILYYKHRRARMAHETLARLVEKGLPVPPELLDPPRRRGSGLRGGLVLAGLGIGLGVLCHETGTTWTIGLIPGLMGVALILAAVIERKKD